MPAWIRGIAAFLLGVVFLGAIGLALFLLPAHRQIRAIDPPLPDAEALRAAVGVANGPVRVSYVNTSSQSSGGGREMGHPAFLFEWADGRGFLIDAGMEPDAAIEFGRLIALLRPESGEVRTHGSVADQLGRSASRIEGIAFTHLHTDHTQGILALCRSRGGGVLPVFQVPLQDEERNHTTDMGFEHLVEARGCATPSRLGGGPIHEIPGFAGLVAVSAGGHTPGSSVYLARIGDRLWLFSGDVTNTRAELLGNLPKPTLYSLLVVPESPARLERMRLWLAELDRAEDLTVVVSHDLTSLEGTPIPAWSSADGTP